MPAEDHKNMKKVQCWIPQDTWDKIVSLGYDSPTIAVTEAFKKLLEDPREDPRTNPLISPKDPLESPEIPVYQARIEGLEMILREKDRSIERLENDLNKAGQREEDLKQMHNNYMLQIQSLINARALTPSGSTQEENKTTTRKEEHKHAEEEHKHADRKTESNQLIEKTCKNCNQPFFTDNLRKEYCSRKCKDAVFRKNKKERDSGSFGNAFTQEQV